MSRGVFYFISSSSPPRGCSTQPSPRLGTAPLLSLHVSRKYQLWPPRTVFRRMNSHTFITIDKIKLHDGHFRQTFSTIFHIHIPSYFIFGMRCLISANAHYPMFALDASCIFAEGVRNRISNVCCILLHIASLLPAVAR